MNNDKNLVLHLQYKDNEYSASPISTYGLDASTILEMYMGRKARVAEVDELLKTLFDLIDEERYPEAKRKLNELTMQYGDTLPEIVQARTMLDFNVVNDD